MTQKTIKRNIEEFANTLFVLIADDTQAGHERLISVFTKAKTRYLNEGYIKSRTQDFDDTLENITNFPDSMNCLLEVLNFVSGDGGWEINSANTILFFELIYATGYKLQVEAEETELSLQQQGDVFELKKSLCEYIIANNNEHDDFLRAAEIKRLELEAMRTIKLKKSVSALNLENVLILDTPELAKESLIKNPEKTIFCLRCIPRGEGKNPLWHLSWYDLQGKPNYLPVANEFLSLLGSLKDNRLPNPNTDIFGQLKICCANQIDSHFNVYLFDKGIDAGTFSRKNPDKHSLCLSSVKSAKDQMHLKWQLTWYDLLGKPNHIAISDKLTSLLHLLKEYQVPSSDTELHYKIKIECIELVEKLLSKVQLLINPANNLLSGLSSTYVLTTSPSAALKWYDSLGAEQPIPLVAGSALKSWLEGALSLSEESILRLKTYLMHMNIRQEVDRRKKMNVLGIVQQTHGLSLKPTCIGVNIFLAEKKVHYKPCSFVITKEKESEVWKLYYIDSLQKPILAKLQDCPLAETIINKWTGEPSSLKFVQLQELGKVLVDFKPSTAIKPSKVAKLELLLAKRKQAPPSAVSTVESKPDVVEIPHKIMPLPVPKKLEMKKISAISSLFAKELPVKKNETKEIETKNLQLDNTDACETTPECSVHDNIRI